jgi:DNA-binding response OmpR family regulator
MVPRGRGSILLVDNELDIINSIKRWLNAAGFMGHGFTDPLKALQYFEENYDEIDLVLSDIKMLKMNGYELVKRIKTIRPQTKIIFMTALETDRSEVSKVLPSINIDGFLVKPGSLENLVYTIKIIM